MVSEMSVSELKYFLTGKTTRCEGFKKTVCTGRVMPSHDLYETPTGIVVSSGKLCRACDIAKLKDEFEEEMKKPGDKWYMWWCSQAVYDPSGCALGSDYLACCTAKSCKAAISYWGDDLTNAAIAMEELRRIRTGEAAEVYKNTIMAFTPEELLWIRAKEW